MEVQDVIKRHRECGKWEHIPYVELEKHVTYFLQMPNARNLSVCDFVLYLHVYYCRSQCQAYPKTLFELMHFWNTGQIKQKQD